MVNFTNISDHLLEAIPEINSIYREHLVDYDSVLNYILFEQLFQFIMNPQLGGGTEKEAVRDDLFDRVSIFMETALESNDDSVRNLVAVSFLEPLLLYMGSQSAVLLSKLGPKSRALYKVVEDYFSKNGLASGT